MFLSAKSVFFHDFSRFFKKIMNFYQNLENLENLERDPFKIDRVISNYNRGP